MSNIASISKKSRGSYKNSIAFLGIIIILTLSLHFYIRNLDIEISKLDTKTLSLQKDISQIKQDPTIQAYSLLETNRNILAILTKKSRVDIFINEMKNISLAYGLPLKGFNFSAGKIEIQMNAKSDEFGLSYKKLSHFIKQYRADTKSMFDLGFITSIDGSSNMKSILKFDVKK